MSGGSAPAAAGALARRSATALVLGPLVIAAVLWLPPSGFALFMALVILAGAWEWAGLAGFSAAPQRLLYVGLIGTGLALLWAVPVWQPWLVGAAALWWVATTWALARVRQVEPRHGPDLPTAAVGLLVLTAPWAALVQLQGRETVGPVLVLFLLLLIWFADSAAYFAGRRWGRVKLAPALSPGKTWAGAYGALVVAALGGLLLGPVLAPEHGLDLTATLAAVLVCALTVVVSVVGDLYESLLKRRRGLKDSGAALPGHGGFLDRIDSLTSAAPLFLLGIHFLAAVHP